MFPKEGESSASLVDEPASLRVHTQARLHLHLEFKAACGIFRDQTDVEVLGYLIAIFIGIN